MGSEARSEYCRRCGGTSSIRANGEDGRPRPTCETCGFVTYDNPKIVIAVLLYEGDRVLWMLRGTPPYAERWSLPSGFVECGETVPEAATREVLEETGLYVDPSRWKLYGCLSLPDINEVYLSFSAPLPSREFVPSAEATELRMLTWEDLAPLELGYPEPTLPLVREAYEALATGELHGTRGRLWEIRGRDPSADGW